MTEKLTKKKKNVRVRRLFQAFTLLALLWAIVSIVRYLTPTPHLAIAREAVAIGQFEDAANEYRQHLLRRPEDWGARAEFGLLLAEFDRPAALTEFRQIPAGTESYSDALRQIAMIGLATERFDEAERSLVSLMEETPNDAWPHGTLAELCFRRSRPRDALPHAQRAAELDTENPNSYFLLAEILDDLQRPTEMIAPLEKAISLEPENYATHLNLAYAYAEASESEKSARESRWCLIRNPEDVHARRFLALAERALGHLAQAMNEVQTALQLEPKDLECRMLEAELLCFDSKPDEALSRLEPLYKTHSDDRRLAALLARAAAGAGKQELAADYRKQVQKLSSP